MKRMISFFAFAFMATLMCIGQPIVIDGITYSLYNNKASIESVSPNISGNLTIPRSITNKGKDYKVTSIKRDAFKDCSKLTSINTSGVEYIGDNAFENCTGLTDITMPTVLSELGYGAFKGCYNLQSVDIPIIRSDWGGVVKINRYTFSGCKSLVFVKIPLTIKQIEDWAFKDCTSLTDIFLMSTNKPYLYYNAFGGVNKKQIKIHVYQNALSNYQNSEWSEFGGIDTNMSEPKIQKQRLPQDSHTTTSDAVDMGGSVEWATKNLEASSPEKPGGIFAWGETTSKSSFSPSNYSAPVIPGKYAYEKYEIGLRGNKCDAARVKLGGGWRMPSEEEFKELLRQCKQVLHSRENYVEFIAPNGNTLKLPYLPNTNITRDGIENFYWTLDLGERGPICLYFSMSTYRVGYGNGETHFISKNMGGHYGGLIRPVRNKGRQTGGSVQETTLPKDTHKKEVDLKSKLIKDAESGDFQAQKKLAQLYSSSNEKDIDIDKAVNLYTALAIKGDKESQNALCQFRDNTLKSKSACEQLASDYMPNSSNPNEEWNALRCEAACMLGNIKAIKEMIERYKTGNGVKRDSDKEFLMMELGAKFDPELMYQVATTYLDQTKGRYNEQKGIALLTKSADMGNSSACNLLGTFYKNGIHVTKDKKKAKMYLKK